MISDKLKAKNRFLPDVRRMSRLIEWAYFKDKCLHLHELTEEMLETFMRLLGPFYHAVECVEADCYPTVKQFRAELKKFWQKKLKMLESKFPPQDHIHDNYSEEELEVLILALEPLFHKDLDDLELYIGLETLYIWIATTYPDRDEDDEYQGG